MKGSKLLSIQKVAKTLGVTKKEVVGLIDGGYIAAVKVDDTYLVSESAINDFTNRSTQKDTTVSGQQDSGYPPTHAVECHQQELYIIEETVGDDAVFTGSVTHTKGRYISQITLEKLADGKRKRESKSFKTREEAESHLEARLNELNGAVAMPLVQTTVKEEKTYTDMTVKQFVTFYLDLEVGRGTSRTQEGYREDMSVIVEEIGHKAMVDITEDIIRKLFNGLAERYSQSVLSKRWGTCKRIFTYAYKKKYISTDVFEDLKKPSSRKIKEEEEYKALSDVDIERIMDAAKSHKELYTMFAVLRSTGMRPGELRALKWKNYNANEKTIRIENAIARKYDKNSDIMKKGKYTEILSVTKSKYSVRTLHLSDEAVDALNNWKSHLGKQKKVAMKESQYIFSSQTGSFTTEDSIRCKLARFIKKHQLEDVGLHLYRFRHTMCTRLILDGLAISIIQRIMGDNTQDVIMKIYTHVNVEDVKMASQRYFEAQNKAYQERKASNVA